MINPGQPQLSKRDTIALVPFKATLSSIRSVDRGMTTGQLELLLDVAGTPGLGSSQYAQRLGIDQPVASRSLLELGPRCRNGSPGLGLVDSVRDPVDLRQWHYALTPKGVEVITSAIRHLNL